MMHSFDYFLQTSSFFLPLGGGGGRGKRKKLLPLSPFSDAEKQLARFADQNLETMQFGAA